MLHPQRLTDMGDLWMAGMKCKEQAKAAEAEATAEDVMITAEVMEDRVSLVQATSKTEDSSTMVSTSRTYPAATPQQNGGSFTTL